MDDQFGTHRMQQILFLTRGHGYGHAATDLPIIEHLRQLLPAVEIKIASYGTGLEYYRLRSVDCADLAIDDNDDQTTEACAACCSTSERCHVFLT